MQRLGVVRNSDAKSRIPRQARPKQLQKEAVNMDKELQSDTQNEYKISSNTRKSSRWKLAHARLDDGITKRTFTIIYRAREITDKNTNRAKMGAQNLYMGSLQKNIWLYNNIGNKTP